MKKIIYILLSLAVVFSSCEKYLEEEPTDLISDATFYKTYDQAVLGIATAYAQMRSRGQVMHTESMPSDICREDGYYDWLWTPSSHPDIPYSEYYTVISEANVTMEKARENAGEINASLPTSSASQALKDSDLDIAKMFEGEARFIRALMYFKLVSFYGDVPLILQSFVSGNIPTNLSRSSRDSVYIQIREDMKFAIEYCAPKDLVPAGRVTRAAAAGMLAKVDLYWASITLRDEKYWNINLLPAQPSNQAALRSELYAEALDLSTRVIDGEYGMYILEPYFPHAATGSYHSEEHILAMYAKHGDRTDVRYHEGWHGGRGRNLTHYAPYLWDFPTWEDQWNSPKKIYDLDTALNDLLISNNWTLTGDTTRRLWSCLVWRGNPDPPAEVYWHVYEPLARFCGPEHYMPPGLGAAPYENYIEQHRIALNDNNGTWSDQIWTAAGRQLTDIEIWRVSQQPNGWQCGKFRMPYPYPADFQEGDYDHTFSILRLAEVYLLRAEAKFFQANEVLTAEVIADIDVIRERAQNQAPLKQMMRVFDNAFPLNVIKTDRPQLFRDILPAGISGDVGLKILLDERVRELVNENEIRWFDLARFPQIILPNLHEQSLQENPLKVGIGSGSNYYTTTYNMKDRFSVENNLYMLYLPIPESEIEFYPGLKQTYGYKQ